MKKLGALLILLLLPSYLGATAIQDTLIPTGNGGANLWTDVDATCPSAHWQCVDDVPNDGWDSYLAKNTYYSRETYACNTLSGFASIDSIVEHVWAATDASSCSLYVGWDYPDEIWVFAIEEACLINTAGDFNEIQVLSITDETSSEWTQDEINNRRFGFGCASAVGWRQVTSFYVIVFGQAEVAPSITGRRRLIIESGGDQ